MLGPRTLVLMLAGLTACGGTQGAVRAPIAESEPVCHPPTPLAKGAVAPAFALPDANGAVHTLDELRASGPVVVLFIQGTWCASCRDRLERFHAAEARFRAAGANLVAIVPDGPARTARLCDVMRLDFPVLSDTELAATDRFGVMQAVGGLPEAAVFVIDANGTVQFSALGDRVEENDVLDALPTTLASAK